MKKCLAILFLAIFSFQVLPVKVLGKFLGSGQNVEEVQNEGDTGDSPDSKVIKFGEDQIITDYSLDMQANRYGFDEKMSAFIHRAESLPSVHIVEMPTPPPDIYFL